MARLENDADRARCRLLNSSYFHERVLVRGEDCEEITDAIASPRDLLPSEAPAKAGV